MRGKKTSKKIGLFSICKTSKRCTLSSKKFPILINLRHLENDRCYALTHMPHGIGKLASLQSLSSFVVGNGIGRSSNHKVGSLSEFENLDQVRGQLGIKYLQNMRDVELVSMRKNLENKKYLESMRSKWGGSDQDKGGEEDKSVMEGLQPNTQLKELFIIGYGAKEFLSWIIDDKLASQLPNLIKIEIRECSRYNILPPFSQLPSLKSLELHNMKEMVELKEGSLGMPELFPFLESFTLTYLPKLKELWRMEDPSFSQLSELEITNCSNLAFLELHSSPSLSKLKKNE